MYYKLKYLIFFYWHTYMYVVMSESIHQNQTPYKQYKLLEQILHESRGKTTSSGSALSVVIKRDSWPSSSKFMLVTKLQSLLTDCFCS